MFKRICIAGIIGIMLVMPAVASAGEKLVLKGLVNSFSVEAPDRWNVDTRTGLPDSLAAIYQPDHTLQGSPSVIFVTSIDKGGWELGDIIANEEKRFRENHAATQEVALKELEAIKLKNEKTAEIRLFYADGTPQYSELVAYIDNGTYLDVITLSSRSAKAVKRNHAAYNAAVASYTQLLY